MVRLLSIIVLLVAVIVILDILRSKRDLEKKVLWIIVVIFLPLLGSLLYYIIARESKNT